MFHIELIEGIVRSQSRSFERKVWTLIPETDDFGRAIVFLDGELYIERVQAPQVVRQLQQRQTIPTALAVFVSHHSAAARHQDFVCCPEYAAFVANDVVDGVRQQYPHVREFVIAGLSLSGLAAADVVTRYPATFPTAICQSPSFWWERGRFADELPTAERARPRLWISVGNRETESGICHPPSNLLQEMSQIAGCTLVVTALRAKGYEVHYREYDGGHDPQCWKADLALAMERLMA